MNNTFPSRFAILTPILVSRLTHYANVVCKEHDGFCDMLHLDGASQVHCRAATDRDVARHWGPPDPNHRHHHHEEGLMKRVQGMRFVCNELAKVSPQARDTLRHMELLRSADREIERRRAGAGGM